MKQFIYNFVKMEFAFSIKERAPRLIHTLVFCFAISILGADITDYFNYGFTEETWKAYCEKQRILRVEAGSSLTAIGAIGTNTGNLSRLPTVCIARCCAFCICQSVQRFKILYLVKCIMCQ